MQIKELNQQENLQNILIRLPNDIYKRSSLPMYGIKTKEVYLQGWTMGDFFVKIDLNSSKIYPMFWNEVPKDIQDWEVVEINNK